jgi:hypothetical protein
MITSIQRCILSVIILTSTILAPARAADVSTIETLAKAYKVPDDFVIQCQESAAKIKQKAFNTSLQECLNNYNPEKYIERIDVYGRYIGLQVPEITGRYILDKNFIDSMPRNTGDINDLILLLPGVQGSENALKASNTGEIRAKLLSISGGQPWQTGFYLDGLNFNSRQDPGSAEDNISSINEVSGAPQTFNVNSDIVESVEVFNNNIPAKFGFFSGGVVDIEGLDAFNSFAPSLSLSYRTTDSNWGSFHLLNGFDSEDNDDSEFDTIVPLEDQVPIYKTNSYSFLASNKINDNHGLLLSGNFLKSEISDISLQQLVESERENINFLVKYSMRNTWIEKLDWSILYAPYQDHNFLSNVKDSSFTIDGGGIGSILRVSNGFTWGQWETELSVNYSDNSRKAPSHYYLWQQAKGLEWGVNDPNNLGSDVSYSKSGGFGNLDKTQLTTKFKHQVDFDSIDLFGTTHYLQTGISWIRDRLTRIRDQDSYYYNSSVLYSTSDADNPLNCSGYQLDCIGITYGMPLEQLTEQLGGNIDFTNPEHVQAYSDNVLTTPQYFQARIVYGAEDIDVNIDQYSTFIEDQFDWGRAEFRLGLRYDYDDFFKRHNVAPRLSTGIDVFNTGNSLFVLGLNRYYDAGLLTYKVKELARPYYVQYRPIQNGYLQGWVLSSDDSDYRYRYENVKTPYNDEAVIGWKQSTEYFGTFALNYVYRWQKEQLARAGESILDTDGYRYAYQNNSGKGTSERISLSWSAKYGRNSLWANMSHTQNQRNNNDYDSSIDDVPLDELVFYDNELITKDKLTRINSNFSRPITANMGWTIDWEKRFTASLTANYVAGYTSAVSTGASETTDTLTTACDQCASYNLTVPFYKKVNFKARTLINVAMTSYISTDNLGDMQVRLDINNLFNSRTHTVIPGDSGIEVGRKIWLGIKYNYD